jgi:hypothetical protein
MAARRSKADIAILKTSLASICGEYQRITVRQLFYQAVSRGLVAKTEKAYKGVVCRLTSDLRWSGELDMDQICDNTRAEKVRPQWRSMAEFIRTVRHAYRLNYWDHAPEFVQVWLEKEALSGVIRPMCDRYGVGLWVSRGYSSISMLSSAAEQLAAKTLAGIPCTIAQLGDHDPSGENIGQVIHRDLIRLVEHHGGRPELVKFQRVALTVDQVTAWQLPTRPTKTSDSRSANFDGESVELDAVPPDQLIGLVQQAILEHVDQTLWSQLQERQRQDEAAIRQLVDRGEAC